MKVQTFLLIACLISISHYTYSQEKGYYSIGNNKNKLKTNSENTAGDSFIRADKGYYSMEPNRTKLGKRVGVQHANYRRIPLVNKGYYSIGNNREKLSAN